MKVIVTVPDEAGVTYGRLHSAIVGRVGGNGQVPMEVRQCDCTTHPDNYAVLMHDAIRDGDNWRDITVLTFKHKPGVGPSKPLKAVDEDEEVFLKRIEDWEHEAYEVHEAEEVAMGEAMWAAGFRVAFPTRESNVSPTGRPYVNQAIFEIYEKHVVITQSGGRDT